MTNPFKKLLSGKKAPEGKENKGPAAKKPGKVSRSRILAAVSFLFFLAALWFSARALTNLAFVRNLDRGIYKTENESRILLLNWPEGHVPAYNLGNASYLQGDYESAQQYYAYAMQQDLKEGEECAIRINLALSLLATVRYDLLDDPGIRSQAVRTLTTARGVLLEMECAKDGEEPGHSPEAQKLKDEIDALLRQIQDPDEIKKEDGQGESEDPNEGEDEKENSGSQTQEDDKKNRAGSEWENSLRQKLQKERDAAARENARQQSEYEAYQHQKEQGGYSHQEEDKGEYW